MQVEKNKKNSLKSEEQIIIENLYQELLKRDVDQEGLNHFVYLMQKKNYQSRDIRRLIKNSDEYLLLHSRGKAIERVMENLKINDQEILEGKAILKSKPYTFNIDLIGVCNMKPPCVMCLNWEEGIGPRHHSGLTKSDINRFGDFIRLSYNVINCGIGEPLLARDFIPILELFSSWEKRFGINSNGIALSPQFTDQLIPFLDILTITFSVDAATAETYAKIRGNHFHRVIDNIAYYCEKRQQLFPEGLSSKVGLVMIPMRVNRHEVKDFVRLTARLGVDVVELRTLNEIKKDWLIHRDDFLFDYQQQMLTQKELEEVRLEAAETAAECGIILDCQYEVSEEYTYEFFLPAAYRKLNIKCALPWRFLLPYKNGDTYGCCYMTESLGNWRQKGLEVLWNSKRMQKMRREMASGELPEECWKYHSCPVVKAERAKKGIIDRLMDKKEIIGKVEGIKLAKSRNSCDIIR